LARVRKKSAVPVYAVASIWLFWGLFLPMYKISHFVILGIISYGVYKVNSFIFRGKWVEVADPEPEPELTGDKELDELIVQGHQAVRQMRQFNQQIHDVKLSEQINRLEEVTGKIFKYVEKNPESLPQVRKFMNYYLPTTLKMLQSYTEMAGQGVNGKNIDTTMAKVEEMMDTIVRAFEKQLDSLFGAKALDISTDITVLENMLVREGLIEDELKKGANK